MSNPDVELPPDDAFDPATPDLGTDEQHERYEDDEPLDDPEGDQRRDGNDAPAQP